MPPRDPWLSPLGPLGLPSAIEDRIMPEPNSGCWLWTGALKEKGYARIVANGNHNASAYRIIYEYFSGPIPDDLVIDHLCRTTCCVNPAHLEPVPNGVNTLRGIGPSARNARKTHCPNGHPYDAVNTRIYSGRRRCAICDYEGLRRRRAISRGTDAAQVTPSGTPIAGGGR